MLLLYFVVCSICSFWFCWNIRYFYVLVRFYCFDGWVFVLLYEGLMELLEFCGVCDLFVVIENDVFIIYFV